MKNILLATDLEANSDRAMERALKIAKEQKARLRIVHVSPPYLHPKNKKLGLSLQKDTEELIQAYLHEYKDFSDVETEIIVKQGGDVFFEILESAYKGKADLIVAGMHNKEKFRDLFIGTTIERIVRKGIKPVLMVKNKPTNSYQSVVSAVDFSPCSRAAMRMAMELVPKAAFCAVHAYSIPDDCIDAFVYVHTQKVTDEAQRKMMDAFLKTERSHFVREHHGEEKKLSGVLVKGVVYESILEKAKKVKANLITIGTHSRADFIPKLGGIAGEILSAPPCDVLVASD